MEYKTLEPGSLSSLGIPTPTFNGGGASFFATSTFVYTLFFVAIVGAAFYRYGLAGVLRMEASENTIRRSNEIFKQVTLGLLGVFSLFLILFTVNKGLVTGDVGLSELGGIGRGGSGGVIVTTIGGGGVVTTSGGSSRSCESKEATIAKINSSGGICGGATCTALSGCNYSTYLPIIERETSGDSELRKMIIVTMCKESKANPNAQNKNPGGTYDCGLMQVNNGTLPCDATTLSPDKNIKEGVRLMRQKMSASSQIYPGFPARAGVFASYNCCANGTVPNSPSADCTAVSGFPFAVPKWACPINPGEGVFNMCSVKNYACDLVACMDKL